MEPTTAAQKSRAQLRRIVADESQRFPALLLASVMCTIASLIAAAAFFAIRPHAGWLVPVMLLQIAVIVCAVVAQQAVHGPAAWSRCRKRRCDGGRMLADVRTNCCSSLATGTFVTMSVGIAAERVTSLRDGAALRARADEALYMAKRKGRDRVPRV